MKNGKQNIAHNKVIQQQESQRLLPLAFLFIVCAAAVMPTSLPANTPISTHIKKE